MTVAKDSRYVVFDLAGYSPRNLGEFCNHPLVLNIRMAFPAHIQSIPIEHFEQHHHQPQRPIILFAARWSTFKGCSHLRTSG